MRCVIIGALPVAHLPITIQKGDFVIAADKGYQTARKLKLRIDLVVGDFDSLGRVPTGDNVVILPVEKDQQLLAVRVSLLQ